jgi:hypothetical protein
MILNGDRDELGRYLRSLADEMGLRDWIVGIADVPPDVEDCNASITIPHGRQYAMVHMAPGWEERDVDSLRQTMVHELLHCHFAPLQWVTDSTASTLGMAAFQILSSAHNTAEEVAIDTIAREWAESLPLPIKAEQAAA